MIPFPITMKAGLCAVVVTSALAACSPEESEVALVGDPSPYLFIYAGDYDRKDADFLAILDVDPDSPTFGQPLFSLTTGLTDSMPHHMEYVPPPPGEPLFMNAHHDEASLVVDISNLPSLGISKSFTPPPPFRFPHDYSRTEAGTRLVGFLRSETPDIETETGATLKDEPFSESICRARPGAFEGGYHGGIAEYSASGELLRSVSAAVDTLDKAVRPYAFAQLPDVDRFVVTSAPMTETSWAEVLQIYRYSNFQLLHTLPMPAGEIVSSDNKWKAKATGFGLQGLDDGSVFLNSYECSFYHLTRIETDDPKIERVFSVKTDQSDHAPHACGIPVLVKDFWVQPVGKSNRVVVLDIADPDNPKEVFRLETPDDFRPHWLSKDPQSNRLVLGAELGGEQGFYVLRIDEKTGALDFDDNFQGRKPGFLFSSRTPGYISLDRDEWPHGDTGGAWGHAGLFLDRPKTR